MHRIVFTGAQGTGKTTILNYFREQGQNVITEVVRNLAKKGVKINKDGDEKGQARIFKEYEKLLGEITQDGYISDRGLIDVTAYTVYLYNHGKVSEDFANKQLKKLHKFILNHPSIVYCYFPIEFPLVEDGVRDLDEEFRKEIDSIILSLLGTLNLSFVIVNGTVEQRIEKIKDLKDWMDKSKQLFSSVSMNK